VGISSETIAWLKQRLGRGCEEVPVQGDRPLLLDDPSCAYLTLSEHHQVFCVGYEQGRAVGRREHMAVCEPGQLLFGLEPAPEKQGATALILSGVSGSIVWRVPTALLLRLAEEPEGLGAIGALFDAWIELLIATLPPTPVPTRSLALQGGERVETDGVLALRSDRGLIWIAPRAPRSYLGIPLHEQADAPPDPWPLTESAWAQCDSEPLAVSRSADWLRTSPGAHFADGFYRFVVRVVSARRAGLAQLRLSRDALSRRTEEDVLAAAFSRLAAVGRGDRLPPEVHGADEFDRACLVIAQWLGVETPHVVRPPEQSLSQMQLALSRSTSLRARPVLIEHDWHRHDGGPLLGFIRTEAEPVVPVALLPSRKGYILHDPRADAPQRVTPALANNLLPQAHQFYATLPSRPLSPMDVLRFSSSRGTRDLMFVVLVGVAAGSLGTLVPLLTGQVFDRIIPGAERSLLLQLTLVLLAVLAGQLLFDVARGLALVRAQTRTDVQLEAGVWDRLLSLPVPFFRTYSAGDLAARAAGIGAIRRLLAGATLSALLSGVFSAWNFAFLFFIDARLSLAATGLVLLPAAVAGVAAFYALARQRAVADLDGRIAGVLLQLFTGMAKLRVSGTENRAFGVWARLFAKRRDADIGAERVRVRVAAFQVSYPTVCNIALFWLLAGQGPTKLSTGQFLAFSAAFTMFLAAVLNLIESGLRALSAIPMYERAKPILIEPVERKTGGDARIELSGAIEMSHVSFRYEPRGPPILDDVNLSISPGEFVAIVGPSGSGKSTLLRLLLGFDSCSEGGVFYDRQALAGLDIRVARQQIGVVLQNSRPTAGDICSNIVGNRGLTLEDAWRAARQAAIDREIEAMPMGMHTVISQGGGTLSGGQIQRLLIARALAGQPKVLFLDEATSALDNVSQTAVGESLERLCVTRVVIAHRLSTIRHADQIVVLDHGRIVQRGRYEELIAQGGVFRELARRQTL
jgi:NHLM bacteriocin system ABC transporter ATP-binding protein